MSKMQDCPKFSGCSAAVCPLDHDWRLRNCEEVDRTCFYLTESVKAGGHERIKEVLNGEMLLACVALREAPDLQGACRRAVEAAVGTGSLIEKGRRLARNTGKRAI